VDRESHLGVARTRLLEQTIMKKRVVGLGELLWDMLPGGKHLGGAPANFAYITTLLGGEGIVASRVGHDNLGEEAIAEVRALGLSEQSIQRDSAHATGIVRVDVDKQGCAEFEIEQPSAWDFFEWTPEWSALARSVDAVCFGSLAQRAPISRATIAKFIAEVRREAIRIFDVNLRAPFYDSDVVAESMKTADILKVSDEEIPKVMALVGLTHSNEAASARQLIDRYEFKLVCITRGGKGSLLVTANDSHEQPGIAVSVADTVGAGDAFTAALVHSYLRGEDLAAMNRLANRVGAWVASERGPTPRPKDTIWNCLEAADQGNR